jgi:O-antigen/teichoic acid export membrane protein
MFRKSFSPAPLICIFSNIDKEASERPISVDTMVKDKIRLRYSGLLVFTSKILSLATGFGFVLMITRSISGKEFGIWGNINDILGYFTLLNFIVPFWVTRFVSREHAGSAKTGLVSNMLMSVASALIYIALFPIIMSVLHIDSAYTVPYIVLSIIIIQAYAVSAFEAILIAEKPHTLGYGLLVSETFKVVLGFILIIQLKMGLEGVVYTIVCASAIQVAFYLKLTANILKESINWNYVKEWLKASPILLYNTVGSRIAAFTLIFLFVYGELARGYFQAVTIITAIVGYSLFLASALYPKLLSQVNLDPSLARADISTSFKMVLLCAIPMAAGAIVLSDSYLAILSDKVDYTSARIVLSILALSTLVSTLSQVFYTIVVGVEKIDAKAKIAFRQLKNTRLFQVFTLPYIQSAIALPATFFVLFYIAKTPLEAVTYFAYISLIVELIMLLCRFVLARKCLSFSFPWKSVMKYVLASTIMVAILIILPHPEQLLQTVGITMLGALIYFGTLIAIDHETREMARSTMNVITSWLSKIRSKQASKG